MEVACPICHKKVKWEGNAYRPFCSERCKLLDLEGWLSARYRVPVEEERLNETEESMDEEGYSTNGRS